MSKANPKKAMEALIPPGLQDIRPMTLGMYAALERIKSPLITGEDAKDTLELIPSLYLLTHDPIEVFRGNILELAMAWADTVPVETVERIRAAANAQIRAFLGVNPPQDEAPKSKKKTTDGSRSGLSGRHEPTTGATPKSCGESRSRRSRSSDARSSTPERKSPSSRSK